MICLRFDVDTRRGLVVQTPPLLDLLARHGLRATFFVVMGRDANLWEIVRLRFLAPKAAKSALNVTAKGGLTAVLGAALVPRAVGHRHPELLLRMRREGHEVQPHGWSHIQWQRNLDRIDAGQHLRRSMDALKRITGEPVTGFASPGRTFNESALAAFDDAGLTYVGDMDGPEPFVAQGRRHLQLPVTRFETIAQMRARNLDDDAIVATWVADIEANPAWCCLYEHPDDLGPAELAIFDRLFAAIAASGREAITLTEAATAWAS